MHEARRFASSHVGGVARVNLPPELRTELRGYLAATAEERAQVIHRIFPLNEALGDILIDLEANDDLRTQFELQLLQEPRA